MHGRPNCYLNQNFHGWPPNSCCVSNVEVIPYTIHIPIRLEKSHLSENASENGGGIHFDLRRLQGTMYKFFGIDHGYELRIGGIPKYPQSKNRYKYSFTRHQRFFPGAQHRPGIVARWICCLWLHLICAKPSFLRPPKRHHRARHSPLWCLPWFQFVVLSEKKITEWNRSMLRLESVVKISDVRV